jgi:hypothetical protein
MTPRRLILIFAVFALLAPSTAGAAARKCGKVQDPFAGTRYAGEDIKRIRAKGVKCRRARRVAVGAQRKALGLPARSSIRHFRYKGWRVTGDISGSTDKYVARRDGGAKVVRWRF